MVILFEIQQCELQFIPPTPKFSYLVVRPKRRLLCHVSSFSTTANLRLEEEEEEKKKKKKEFPNYVSHPINPQ